MTAKPVVHAAKTARETAGNALTVLEGKRILITRPRAQAHSLCERLTALGAQPITFPTIEITSPADYGPLDRALAATPFTLVRITQS